jgi:hypothetical protein
LSSPEEGIANAIASSVFPTLSCISFKIPCIILRSLIYFESKFGQNEKKTESSFSCSAGRHPVFPATCVEDAGNSSIYVLGAFVKNYVGIIVWIHIQVLYSIPLVFISVSVPIPCCLYYYGSLVPFEVRFVIPPELLFMLSISLLFMVFCASR